MPQLRHWVYLHHHACIERQFPGGGCYAWEFVRNGEAFEIEVSGPLVADESGLMLSAALDGVGLAFLHEPFVGAHVARGDLVQVLREWCQPLPRFYLYYPGRRQVPPPLRAFIDMLRSVPVSD